MKENIFSIEAVKRQEEQDAIQKKLKETRKVPMNITLPIECKKRLQEYARKKHLSASILIQLWIDQYCV